MRSIENSFIWKFIVRIEEAVLIITSSLAVLLLVAGVFTRYVLKSDIFGLEEIMTVVAMWLYWMGGIYASYEDSHIKADIGEVLIKSAKWRKIHNVIVQVITLFGLVVFTKWGLDYLQWNLTVPGKSPGLGVPLIISQIPLTIGFIMMSLYSVYHLVRTFIPAKVVKEVSA